MGSRKVDQSIRRTEGFWKTRIKDIELVLMRAAERGWEIKVFPSQRIIEFWLEGSKGMRFVRIDVRSRKIRVVCMGGKFRHDIIMPPEKALDLVFCLLSGWNWSNLDYIFK